MQFNQPWGQQPSVPAGPSAPRGPCVDERSPQMTPGMGVPPGFSFQPQAPLTFTQPHMAKYHTGMNGFPLSNGSMLSSHAMPQMRVPFASSITMYQFPSPTPVYTWSGQGTDGPSQTTVLSALQTSYAGRPSIMSTNENSLTPSIAPISQMSQCSSFPMTNGTSSNSLPNGGGLRKSCGKYPKKSSAANARALFHSKRKVGGPTEESGPPVKVFINEERMSACLRDMNLDNNNLGWHPDLEEQPWFSPHPANNNNNNNNEEGETSLEPSRQSSPEGQEQDVADIEDCSSLGLPRLELSKELKLNMKTKQLLPKVILDEIAKPQLQVVLWKPPGDCIKETIQARMSDPLTPLSSSDDPCADLSTEMSETESQSLFSFPFAPSNTLFQPTDPQIVSNGSLPSAIPGYSQTDDCMDL